MCGVAVATEAFRFFSIRVVLRLRRSVSVWADDGRYARSVVSRTHLRIAKAADNPQPRADRRRHATTDRRLSAFITLYTKRTEYTIYYTCSASKCLYNIIYTNTENACILYVYINVNSVYRYIFTLIATLQSSTASPE